MLAEVYALLCAALAGVGMYGLVRRSSLLRLLLSFEILASGVVGLLALLPTISGGSAASLSSAVLLLAVDSTMVGLLIALVLMVFRLSRAREADELRALRG